MAYIACGMVEKVYRKNEENELLLWVFCLMLLYRICGECGWINGIGKKLKCVTEVQTQYKVYNVRGYQRRREKKFCGFSNFFGILKGFSYFLSYIHIL